MFQPQRAIDSVFLHQGIDAVLDPDGVALGVKLLAVRSDEVAQFHSVEIIDESGIFEIRAADFQGHGTGAVLAFGSERRRVQSHRARDPRRLKVTLYTVETS